MSQKKNTLYGCKTGQFITTGHDNSLFGYNSGANLTTQNYNTLVGGESNTSNLNNVVLGYNASSVNGLNNTVVGYNAKSGNFRNCVILGSNPNNYLPLSDSQIMFNITGTDIRSFNAIDPNNITKLFRLPLTLNGEQYSFIVYKE